MKTIDIETGEYYLSSDGVLFLAGDILTLDGRRLIAWEVARVDPDSRSYHRVGNHGDWPLATFGSRMKAHWTRRCRVCRCTDRAACRGGCWWEELDLCSECSPAAIAERGLAS